MRSLSKAIVLATIITFLSISLAYAQTPGSPPRYTSTTAISPSEQSGDEPIEHSLKKNPDGYLPTTLTNLSNMYWAVGMFDVKNDKAVDNYMKINNCSIYKRFYHNDFEWGKVREAARQYLLKNAPKMPIKFEALLPIFLGRYDVDTQQFEINPSSQQHGLLRIDIQSDFGEVCGSRNPVDLYPASVVVILNRPFSLQTLHVDPEIVKYFLQEISAKRPKDGSVSDDDESQRIAYLRLKMRMLQYKDLTYGADGAPRPIIYAQLDGWEVYADEAEMKPLYMYTYTRKDNIKNLLSSPSMPAPKVDAEKEYVPSDSVINAKP